VVNVVCLFGEFYSNLYENTLAAIVANFCQHLREFIDLHVKETTLVWGPCHLLWVVQKVQKLSVVVGSYTDRKGMAYSVI
jgi:hypothetical protein